MRHESAWLRDYLVSGVEDPRVNIQSILTRHFIVRALFGGRFEHLMEQEIHFGAVMNWLTATATQGAGGELRRAILDGLQRRADNAEGIPIPEFVARAFARLPAICGTQVISNYIEQFLEEANLPGPNLLPQQPSLRTFQNLWAAALLTPDASSSTTTSSLPSQPVTILEPACGSANDYRFFNSYGIAPFLDYTGLDLCAKNIENAKTQFHQICFEVGNIFDLPGPDKSFELVVVHDLFEHLSLEGLQVAVKEVCRVARRAVCIGFFQMDEISDHILRPVDEYHWNLLSMARMREMLASQGFRAQVIHIGTYLRETMDCDQTHNPNAYTFLLSRGSEFQAL
jgi:SAM-dependent methyltransferase